VVCEQPIRRKAENQRVCIDRRCKSELQRFPRAYSWPETPRRADHRSTPKRRQEVPIPCGFKTPSEGVRPPPASLARFWWDGDGDGDHSLYDQDGLTVARVVLDGGRYHLRTPIAIPRQSWADLEDAKRGAESFALMVLAVDPKAAARIARDNLTPHPMGSPLNLQPVPHLTVTHIAVGKTAGDLEPIPEFLRRR
jgi:hypothetical protein